MTRMSDVEAVMWLVEQDPTLRSDFCNLTVVDTPIDFERMQDRLHDIVRAIPKLGQRVVVAPFRLMTPEWVAADLDVSYHLQQVTVPAPGGERELLDACAAIADEPFDRERPLWQFIVFDGLASGGGAMLQKMHHTITDGVGGLKLSLEVVDFEPSPIRVTNPHDRQATATATSAGTGASSGAGAVFNTARAAMSDVAARTVGRAANAITSTGRVLTDPLGTPARVSDAIAFASSLRRQVLVTEGARSDLIDDRSLHRRFELRRFPMSDAKARARSLGGSLNDMFVTIVADALGHYHAALGSDITELRMAMPVSTRGADDVGGNHFAPSRVVVPITSDTPESLFTEIRERLEITKHERALDAAGSLAGLVTNLPAAMLTAAARNQTRTIDFATSNLRGSPVPLYLAGSRIVANYPLGPRTGCALNVSLLSYCDELNIGLNMDPAAITDPALFLRCLDTAFVESCQTTTTG